MKDMSGSCEKHATFENANPESLEREPCSEPLRHRWILQAAIYNSSLYTSAPATVRRRLVLAETHTRTDAHSHVEVISQATTLII